MIIEEYNASVRETSKPFGVMFRPNTAQWAAWAELSFRQSPNLVGNFDFGWFISYHKSLF